MAEAIPKIPLRALGTPKGFRIGVYLEHLEEASFLHGLLAGFRKDPARGWRDALPFEERLEAHLDGVVVGGDLAAEICLEKPAGGEAGEIHAALRVLARLDRREDSLAAWQALDWNDPEVGAAASGALQADLPRPWLPFLEPRLAGCKPPVQQALLRAAGHRRLPLGVETLRTLRRSEAVTFGEIAWYLGRQGDGSIKDSLLDRLARDSEPEHRTACALALSRLGDRRILGLLKERSREAWTLPVLALGQGKECRDALLHAVRGASSGPEAWLALGLHGSAEVLEPLLEGLAGPHGQEAAWSLHLVTGAGLWEPGEPESGEEAEAPFQPTREKEKWQAWWTANRSRFQPRLRYRLGTPVSPKTLVDALLSPAPAGPWRPWLMEELAVAYGLDPRTEADDEAHTQLQALESLGRTLSARPESFAAGRWHFAGVLQ